MLTLAAPTTTVPPEHPALPRPRPLGRPVPLPSLGGPRRHSPVVARRNPDALFNASHTTTSPTPRPSEPSNQTPYPHGDPSPLLSFRTLLALPSPLGARRARTRGTNRPRWESVSPAPARFGTFAGSSHLHADALKTRTLGISNKESGLTPHPHSPLMTFEMNYDFTATHLRKKGGEVRRQVRHESFLSTLPVQDAIDSIGKRKIPEEEE